jgi:hypothetical protein
MSFRVLRFALGVGLLAAGARDAVAQHYVCRTVQRGETVAQAARQLTGHAEAGNAVWLTVIDPSRSTIVRQRDYGRVRPGWQVCVESWVVSTRPVVNAGLSRQFDVRPLSASDNRWWLALGLPQAPSHSLAKRRRERRAATLTRLHQFASSFVHEFERPLVQRARRLIRSRLHSSLEPGG